MIRKVLGVLACSLAVLEITGQAAEKAPADPGGGQAAVVKGNNEFALDLYGRLRTREGNLFFSPESISTALAMTCAGARGQTAEEMAKTLHFTLDRGQLPAAFAALVKGLNGADEKRGYQLRVANALWGQKDHPFLPDFLKIVQDSYGAGLNQVDFADSPEEARQTINSWVEKETNNKIQNLLPQGVLTRKARLVLTNAVYFKGTWVTQFPKTATRDEPFSPDGHTQVTVPLMHQKSPFKYFEGDSFQVLEMPYQGKDLSLTVILPREAGGLADLEKRLTAAQLADWLPRLQPKKVIVTLPKFKLTEEFQMQDVLAAMGMPVAFRRGQADFSGMDGERDLYLSAVVHKAFVDVNEEGTEAEAATGVVHPHGLAIVVEEVPVFRADHPFLFLIRDNRSGSILFLGRVVNPKT